MEIEKELCDRFGAAITMKYIDVMMSPEMDSYPDIVHAIMSGKALLPIVMIDGQIRLSGELSTETIAEKLIEINDGHV